MHEVERGDSGPSAAQGRVSQQLRVVPGIRMAAHFKETWRAKCRLAIELDEIDEITVVSLAKSEQFAGTANGAELPGIPGQELKPMAQTFAVTHNRP
jgi:hypothetical protein